MTFHLLRYILFFLLFTSFAFGQGYQSVGARSAALSGASVCLDDVWAFGNNPGALAGIKSASVGVYYETRFLTKELQTQSAVVAVPLKKGVISFGTQLFGYEQYRNTRVGVGYSMQLAEKISAGVQTNLQHLRLGGNYGNTTSGTVEAGVLATITAKWKIGASVMNIGRSRIAESGDRYTTALRIGGSYVPSKKVTVLVEVEKQPIHPFSFRGAVEYKPIDVIFIRAGAQTGPTRFAFGLGYFKKGISLDLSSSYHQILGWSPSVGFTYQFSKKDAE